MVPSLVYYDRTRVLTWVIKVNTKNGIDALISGRKGQFELCFPDEDGKYRGCYAWETYIEAELYLRRQLAVAPQLTCLKPFLIEQMQVYASRSPG